MLYIFKLKPGYFRSNFRITSQDSIIFYRTSYDFEGVFQNFTNVQHPYDTKFQCLTHFLNVYLFVYKLLLYFLPVFDFFLSILPGSKRNLVPVVVDQFDQKSFLMEIESILETGNCVSQNRKKSQTSDHDSTKPVSKCTLQKALTIHQLILDIYFPFLSRSVMGLLDLKIHPTSIYRILYMV